jgi:hypothetical protein
MTALEKITDLIERYDKFDILQHFRVDYIDRMPSSSAVYPAGLVELSRSTDIVGNVTLLNQYNFSIYYCFEKAAGDDIGAAINADWLAGFQECVQEQSATGNAPVFGDVPHNEKISAQNGVLFEADEGTAIYMVQLSVTFTKKYEVENKWLN